MARVIDWRTIDVHARHKAALGEAHRFRVWQAFRQLGGKATRRAVMMFTGLSDVTVAKHARDLGKTFAEADHEYNQGSYVKDVCAMLEGL